MTSRLCLPFALLLAVAFADVYARDAKMSSAGSGACPDAAEPDAARPAPRVIRAAAPAPARETRLRPVLHGDTAPRTTPRWHSFLPGMFR